MLRQQPGGRDAVEMPLLCPRSQSEPSTEQALTRAERSHEAQAGGGQRSLGGTDDLGRPVDVYMGHPMGCVCVCVCVLSCLGLGPFFPLLWWERMGGM